MPLINSPPLTVTVAEFLLYAVIAIEISYVPLLIVIDPAYIVCAMPAVSIYLPVCAALESSKTISFTDLMAEQKIHETHLGKDLITVDATFEVQENAFVIGKEIRDILWPPHCAVISVKKYVIGSSILHSGDVLQIRYQTYDPQETYEIMEAMLGIQDEDLRLSATKEDKGLHVPNN